MRKKDVSEVVVREVMSLCDGAKTRMRVGSAYSEEFEVKFGVHQRSVLSPLLFAIVVDVITEKARKVVVNESLYVDGLVLLLLFTRPLPRDGGMAENHGAPEAGQLPRVWTRSCRETENRQRVSGAKSP